MWLFVRAAAYPQLQLRYLVNPLNAELNPSCHLLVLSGAHHILQVSGVRVNPVLTRMFNKFFNLQKDS